MFQELKEDNRVLQETKEVLEDQLEGWRARSDKIHQLEKHNLLLKAQVHDMEQVRHLHRVYQKYHLKYLEGWISSLMFI